MKGERRDERGNGIEWILVRIESERENRKDMMGRRMRKRSEREIIDENNISLLSPYRDSLLQALFADVRYNGKTKGKKDMLSL